MSLKVINLVNCKKCQVLRRFLSRFSIFIFLMIFSQFSIFSQGRGGQELILPKSFIYDALTSIQTEQGIVSFADNMAISIDELKSYLAEIDYEKLSPVGKRQFDKITSYINEEDFKISYKKFYARGNLIFSPEFYFKSEKETPWILDYTKKEQMITLPLSFGIGDYASVYMEPSLGQSYKGREDPSQWINHGFTYETGDTYITHENYISSGYTWDGKVGINLRLGIGTQTIGRSLMPSIMMSEYLTDAPYANLRFFSPVFNYDWNITQLTQKTIFYSHRLHFRFFKKKFEISLMEGILPYNHFDMRMLSPFGIYHGMALFREFRGETSSYFGAKFSYTPVKYLRIYGLFSQNEFTQPVEANLGSSEPNGLGGQLGIESFVPTKKGYLHFGIEGYYATPYMFVKESPNVSFAKVFEELVPDTGDRYQWMGSPFGPDSVAGKIVASYENPDLWSVETSYTFAALGEFAGDRLFKNAKWDFDNLGGVTANDWVYIDNPQYKDGAKYIAPHGIPEFQNKIAVKGTWKPTEFLTIVVQPGFKWIFNYNHEVGNFKSGFEIGLATKLNLAKIGTYRKTIDF